MSALLLIAIGPVQEFIASARKLRDLWFGSHMLSELSKTVARSLHDNGADLIFPAIDSAADLEKDSDLTVANKILAKVSSMEEADRLQRDAREAFFSCLRSFGDETLVERMERNQVRIKIDEDRFRSQLEDYGEFYAVRTEISPGESYHAARTRAERLLASRKGLRIFQAPGWKGAGIPKNSLDGMRESVLAEKSPEITGLLKKNEKLDAIGFIKRFYYLTDKSRLNRRFNDLADIALMPWLEGIADNEEAISLLNAFQEPFKEEDVLRKGGNPVPSLDLRVESELFYADIRELRTHLKQQALAAWESRRKLVRHCGEPFLYGAILVGDGDRMGRMLDKIETEEGHRTVGRELARFAKEVGEDIKEAGGSLIYSGGDDVMAYLPLHRAVGCADALRKRFKTIMGQACRTVGVEGAPPTFSVGMAFVHHSMPLDQALSLARKAEQLAKTEGGRNALAIIQSKRSGSDIQITGKWEDQDDLKGIGERFEGIVKLYNADEAILPSRLGYQLRDAAVTTGGEGTLRFNPDTLAPQNAASALVRRIFDHKNDGDPGKNAQLRPLLAGRTDIRKLSDELVIVKQIAEADRLSRGGKA